MTDPDLQTQGLAELNAFLEQLPDKLQRNVLRGALRAGAKIGLAEAQRLAPVEAAGPHPGELRDGLKISTSARNGVVRANVKTGKSAFWAKWVEFGTAAHLIRPAHAKSLAFAAINSEVVHHPGAKKKPFMRPALEGRAQAMVNAVVDYIRKRLTKEGLNVPGPEND